MKAYNQRHLPHLEEQPTAEGEASVDTESDASKGASPPHLSPQTTKRTADMTNLETYSADESGGGPSKPKSPRQELNTLDWDKIALILDTSIGKSITKVTDQSAKDMAAMSSRMDVMAKFIEVRRTGMRKNREQPMPQTTAVPVTPILPTRDTMRVTVESLDLSMEVEGSGLDNDLSGDTSPSDSDTIVPSTSHVGDQPQELVNVISRLGNLCIKHTVDSEGCVCIDITDRLAAIALLAEVDTISQTPEAKSTQAFKCKLAKPSMATPVHLLLPLSPLLEAASNSIIDIIAGAKTSNMCILPKAPKSPTVAITNDWWEPGTPSIDFESLGHLPHADELAKASFNVKLSTLTEWERATRQLMTALSYSHFTNSALCELIQAITHPEQHLPSLQALASSFLILDVGFQSTLLTNAAYLLASINLTRKDYFLKGLHARSRAVPKLTRMLRFAPISSSTLFGDAEDNAITLLNSYNQRQATSNLAKAAGEKGATPSRSRSRSRGGDRRRRPERSGSRPRPEKSLLVDVTQSSSRKVKFNTPAKDKQPFRGGRRGGRGGRGGGKSYNSTRDATA